MKGKHILTVLLVIAASCSYDIDVQRPESQGETITIKAVQAGDDASRTSLVEGSSVWWTPGDDLSLFYGSGAAGGSRFTADITEPSPIANFTGIIDVVTGGGEISMEDTWFWATYPYNANASCDGSSIVTELPCSQVGKAGTFSDKTFITVAKSQGLLMSFYNVCSGLKFSVTNPEVKSVRIKSNSGEPIAGKARISFDVNGVPYISEVLEGTDEITISAPDGGYFEVGENYYITMLPQTLSGGFTVTFETWYEQGVREIANVATFKRSVFNTMASADANVTYTAKPYAEFEDPNFEAYCIENFDTDGDGRISRDEALEVTEIYVSSQIQNGSITSLKGIGVFENLESLSCYGTNYFRGELKSLDVSRNTALTYLDCCWNRQLTSLDVSDNTALMELNCGYNQLSNLDVSNNTALKELECNNNQLVSLDLSNNTALTYLFCIHNQLAILDVSNNTALKELECYGNPLTNLDVSKNTMLTDLRCGSNQLTDLNLGEIALKTLKCFGNQLTSLDVSKNTALEGLDCSGSQLTSLDVSKNTALIDLICGDNQLTNLNVSNNTALTLLWCYGNEITSLDVSKNTALTNLKCTSNPLSYLYIYQGQSIPGVTVNRSTSYIPAETTILVGSSAGGNEGTGEGTNY